MKSDISYEIPAEWFRHSATQLQWPSNTEKWPSEKLGELEEIYCTIIEELHFYEPIHLFVEDLKVRNRVMQKLSTKAVDLDRIIIHQQKVNDIWARDEGPTFIRSAGKYMILKGSRSKNDIHTNIPEYVADKYGLEKVDLGIHLKNSQIDSNGDGFLLASISGFTDLQTQNELTKAQVEKKLSIVTCAEQIIWLESGVRGGDTGHLDTMARWVSKSKVLALISENRENEYYEVLQQNLNRLKAVRLKDGTKLEVETLPLIEFGSRNAKAQTNNTSGSYCSFYIANGVVLVPMFNHKFDETALEFFKKQFSGRRVVGIDCNSLIGERGTIQAITQPCFGL